MARAAFGATSARLTIETLGGPVEVSTRAAACEPRTEDAGSSFSHDLVEIGCDDGPTTSPLPTTAAPALTVAAFAPSASTNPSAISAAQNIATRAP